MRGQSMWVRRAAAFVFLEGRARRRLAAVGAALATTAATLVALPVASAEAAPTDTLALTVVSARTEARAGVAKGDAVPEYEFLINVDDVGSTEQRTPEDGCSPSSDGYPASCHWPSVYEVPRPAPIYTHGTQDDIAAGLRPLPDNRYLITVMADGYSVGGAHFCVDTSGTDPRCPEPLEGPLTVELQPNPLPDSTVRAQVFNDNASTNQTIDANEDGLAGFVGHIADTLGEVQTDVYGNPLCTTYVGEDPDTHEIPFENLDSEMLPVVASKGGECVSDATGMLTIPHLGPNRYAMSATPPDGQTWIQTTTLEGNHDYDAWVMPGSTGYDTEFVKAGEQVPPVIFGFVQPKKDGQPLSASASGSVSGRVMGIKAYYPPKGGAFTFWRQITGTKAGKPIERPWLSLADLENGDQAVWVGRGDADGSFDIQGVPDGNYQLSWWDEPQDYFLNVINVTVSGGHAVQMGNLPLSGWWTEFDGYVFKDANRNGKRDPGEQGVPNFTLTLRKKDNSLMDRGTTAVTTDSTGHYWFEGAYPLNEWTVMEAYSDSFYTTGITYQTDNQPDPTTVKGAGVDVATLNIIGLSGSLDWGVHAYDPTGANGIDPRNGGIVGSISYDTTRNELDPRYAAAEDWQPGIPDIPVSLYATVPCTHPVAETCDADERYQLDADGSYLKGKPLNTYVSEHFERPAGCTARDVDGNPLAHGTDEDSLVTTQETTGECISTFIQGVQYAPYATDQGTPDANFGATVDGNYGFGDGCFDGTLDATDPANPTCTDADGNDAWAPLGAADYLVSLDIPNDASGTPMYQVTREEDINVGDGDQIIPQVPPSACAGALHTVDVEGIGDDGDAAVHNQTFVEMGGSPYEGTDRPLCDTKLVELNNGKSVVPMFNLFTDVPLPSRLRGLVVDDINFSSDPRSLMYGEKAGVPFAPVGIYDFTNSLVTTVESDFNGMYDVLLPSTNHISCPTPSGVCAGMYRFVGNDPGAPGRLNPNWNPRYRTIATEFEALPGVIIPTDLAPTQVGLTVESPQTGLPKDVSCPVAATTPQLFRVSTPYVTADSRSFTIDGAGFGASQGSGGVTLDGTALSVTSWSETTIDVTVPTGVPVGPHQLTITRGTGEQTINAITIHVLGGSYMPHVYEVGPGVSEPRYDPTDAASRSALGVDHAIQNALDDARTSDGDDLVVVYPNEADLTNPRNNPRGSYYENLIMASPVKLQGVGPGGFQGSTFVPGTMLDASAFGGDTDLATDWFDAVGALSWSGNQDVNDGAGIYVLASSSNGTGSGSAREFTAGFKAAIDGFEIRGGDQQGFPGNINDLTGAPTGLPPNIVTQGGAIFANAYASNLQITNNVVQNNGGGYGTIRIGTPDLQGSAMSQHNEDVRIAHNRVIANGGTNLAGAIGIFAGSDRYEVDHNDICGNYTVEYGGGLSVYGLSPNGKIHHNRIYYNQSNDEGGGIMIAGALPADPEGLSPGSGAVDIYANEIQANLANDDGGGIRFLMAGVAPMTVVNNVITNNVSTHEGGGISLNDTPNVRVVNNTVMKNLTTATAVTSNGQPMPAGLSTSANSKALQDALGATAPGFSEPVMFNNIFWDNRAGSRAGTTVTGLGLGGDGDIERWDVGVSDAPGTPLTVKGSVIQQNASAHPFSGSGNSQADPDVVQTYDVSVSFATWRQNPSFVDATLVLAELPSGQLGDYHLRGCTSPACNLGLPSVGTVTAPTTDIDDQSRPASGGFDAGADEFGDQAAPPPPATGSGSGSGSGVLPGQQGPGPGSTPPNDPPATPQTPPATGLAQLFLLPASITVPAGARVDAVHMVNQSSAYLSFANSRVRLPGLGVVQDEDVVLNDGGTWTLAFDGTAHGLTGRARDIDGVTVKGSKLFFSTTGNRRVPGVHGRADDADVYVWNGHRFRRVFDASRYGLPRKADIDGLAWTSRHAFYATFVARTRVPGVGKVPAGQVVQFRDGRWSLPPTDASSAPTVPGGATDVQ